MEGNRRASGRLLVAAGIGLFNLVSAVCGAEPVTMRLIVEVRDARDRPAPGSRVLLSRIEPFRGARVVRELRVEPHGRVSFQIDVPAESTSRLAVAVAESRTGADLSNPPWKPRQRRMWSVSSDVHHPVWQIWAVGTDGSLAWSPLFESRRVVRYVLGLEPSLPRAGHVIDSEGQRIAGARLQPMRLFLRSTESRRQDTQGIVPEKLGRELTMVTNRLGDYSCQHWGPSADVVVKTSFVGQATLITRLNYRPEHFGTGLLEPGTVVLNRPRPVRGRVLLEGIDEMPAGLALRLSGHRLRVLQSSPDKNPVMSYRHTSWTTPDADGTFVFPDAPPMSARIDAVLPSGSTLLLQGGTSAFSRNVDPERVSNVTLLRQGWLHGRVEDQHGNPVPGADVTFQSAAANVHPSIVTDGSGEFLRAIPISDWTIYVERRRHMARPSHMSATSLLRLPVTRLPAIRVVCDDYIRGIVVDADDQPVAGAEVFVTVRDRIPLPGQELLPAVISGDDGGFAVPLTLPFLPDKWSLRARSNRACSGVVIVSEFEQEEDDFGKAITLKLAAETTAWIGGTVIDVQGDPVENITVSAWRHLQTGNNTNPRDSYAEQTTTSCALQSVHTGPGGRFRVGPLWPDVDWYVQAHGDGLATVNSPTLRMRAPDLLDINVTLRCTNHDLTLAGRIVDALGRPIAGVDVHSCGRFGSDSAALSDADGRFRVLGLNSFRDVVFFDHPDYRRAAGIVGRTTDRDVAITLYRHGEFATARDSLQDVDRWLRDVPPLESPSRRTIQLGRELLMEIQSALKWREPTARTINLLARVAPTDALKQHNETYGDDRSYAPTRTMMPYLLREADLRPQSVRDFISSRRLRERIDLTDRVAQELIDTHPEFSRELSQECVSLIEARAEEHPPLLRYRATVAYWEIRHQNASLGYTRLQNVIDDLVAQTETSRSTGGNSHERMHVSRLLSRLDSPQARHQLNAIRRASQPPKRQWSTSSNGTVYRPHPRWSLLSFEPKRASAWLSNVETLFQQTPRAFDQIFDVVRHLDDDTLAVTAGHSAEDAERLTALLKRTYRQVPVIDEQFVRTLAHWEPQRAWDLLSTRLQHLEVQPDSDVRAGNPAYTRFEQASRLVYAAACVGHPDVETLQACLLSFWEHPTGVRFIERADSLVTGLAYLCQINRDLAADLIGELDGTIHAGLLGNGNNLVNWRDRGGISRHYWYMTLAVCDPELAATRLREDLQQIRRKTKSFDGRLIVFRNRGDPYLGIHTAVDVLTSGTTHRPDLLSLTSPLTE